MKTAKKWLALILAVVMTLGVFAGCSNVEKPDPTNPPKDTNATTTTNPTEPTKDAYVVPEEPVVLTIYHPGTKPDNWDAVYAKYLEMTKDTLNIQLNMVWNTWGDYKEKYKLDVTAGEDIDLAFDASFFALKELAADGYYADLSEYFFNPEQYPGLAASFSKDAMEKNMWFGKMNYIPLYQSIGKQQFVAYRLDWAKKWGVGNNGQITTLAQLEDYMKAAKDNGILAFDSNHKNGLGNFLTDNAVGFYGDGKKSTAESGLQVVSAGGLNVWCYIKDNKLVSYAIEGSGDANFANFPEGWQYDFGAARYDKFQEWRKAGYISEDSLNASLADDFSLGQSAISGGFQTDLTKILGFADKLGNGAEIGYFCLNQAVQNREPGAIATNFDAGNGLCVPVTSTKIPYTMKFLDWLFGSKEAHDLFEYGIEGVDFKYGEKEGTIEILSNYSSQITAFTLTHNPNYTYYATNLTDDILALYKYVADASTYTILPAAGFRFDGSDMDVSTAVAQCKAVTDKTTVVKQHGIATDGNGTTFNTVSEMLQANVQEALKNGGQDVVDAIIEQLEDFLASR